MTAQRAVMQIIKQYNGEVPERPKGTDCKSVGDAFGGSNPPLYTILSFGNILGVLNGFLCFENAGVAQWLEHQPSKLRVAGSSPVSRSILDMVN